MMASKSSEVLLIGYGSTMCCLSTIISGSVLGVRHTFVHDASWAKALAVDMPEADAHRHAVAIAGIHGALATTGNVLERQ
jgi:ureidoacrylate peracid hydrolase